MSEEKGRVLVPVTSDSPVIPLAQDYMTWSWPVLTDPPCNREVEPALHINDNCR